jgi:hypothetical protein
MRKYRNITKTTLAIDTFTRTIYIRPGEIVTLPKTRDVRHYSKLKYLVPVKGSKKAKIKVAKFRKPTQAKISLIEKLKEDKKEEIKEEEQPLKKKKRGRKPKKVEEKLDETFNETENS